MDHIEIYKQLYKNILRAVTAFENENRVSGSVQLGILLETLKNVIESLKSEDICPECKKEEEILKAFGEPKVSEKEMETLRECVEMLVKVKEAMTK